MKGPLTRTRIVLLAAAAVLVVGAWGTYRLLRRQHASAKVKRAQSYREIIWRHAQDNSVPTELVEAMIVAESGGNPQAVSPKNARGLMQITPIAEREVLQRRGIDKGDLFDPDYNVLVGTAYLKMLADRFDGDWYLVLAAYHAGPTRVAQLRKAHPSLSGKELVRRHALRSTAAYCRQILTRP